MGRSEAVPCRYVTGTLGEVTIEDVNEFHSPGSVLEQRLVRVNGRVFVRKFVSRAAGRQSPHRYDLLDNEIRAGTRLAQVFTERYPRELAYLFAYNVDAEEPFALLHQYAGEPAAGPCGRFDDVQRRRFEQGLVHAVRLTAAAGVVHGAVTLDAVRWNGEGVQLVDFESAERVGEPRRDGRASAARSPEQVSGIGTVDPRDDLWGAGLLIRALHLGGSAPSDRDGDPERLRALLGPVFDRPLEYRPHAEELLRTLRADCRVPPFVDPEAVYTPGRALFEQLSQSKRKPAAAAPRAKPTRRRRRATTISLLAAVLLVAVVIIGAVVLA